MDLTSHDALARFDLMPPEEIASPAFVVWEDGVRHNLARSAAAAGGMSRLMPHLKTHRAPWIVRMFLEEGVEAFKAATVAEVEMAVAAGARHVLWAYPSASRAAIARFVAIARAHPDVRLEALVEDANVLAVWEEMLAPDDAVTLRVDLDVGMGRTGVALGSMALSLARRVAAAGRFAGWHAYDGHIAGELEVRRDEVMTNAERVAGLTDALAAEGIVADTVAGGSYTFDLWPEVAAYVSPGSFTYSSDQHDAELTHLGWVPAAFVLATVVSRRNGTFTLDAGAKAISPDKPLGERFRSDGRILLMSEEHTVVEGDAAIGTRRLLLPRHACTTAYLYDRAAVFTATGEWEVRRQLGSAR
ncbi:alanine racemase [Acuticoccus mangrovi]|uniref:Alanine racemase n=1 Tax=Acuticoccus mangrovi TaxID=2796142 RepID=A0A934IKV7_9HYPH|nr:alanine racemase [Acuticoccus mangrovi]MBJ3774173.1 alanine racemase [Acuticoccus mangrovi]